MGLTCYHRRTVLANKPDAVLLDKKDKTWLLIDIGLPDNSNINTEESENLRKCKDLEIGLSRMWKVRTTIFASYNWGHRKQLRSDWIRAFSCSQVTGRPQSYRTSRY